MNVLSLFDGMSCGQIALEKLGYIFDGVNNKYFASEIKNHAIYCTQYNYPKTIQLGDIRAIVGCNLPKIDLLIGGSPCQDFSQANKQRKGLEGEKSSLFYEYVRLLKETNPKYYLLENVFMTQKNIDIISNILECYPVRINSNLVSAQLRDRLYWTNIGDVRYDLFGNKYCNIPQPNDKKIILGDIIESGYVDRDKSLCILARYKSSSPIKEKYEKRYRMGMLQIVYEKYGARLLTQLEIERLQTVPEGYTSCLNYNKAVNLLGDGWTIDVIVHILSYMLKNTSKN